MRSDPSQDSGQVVAHGLPEAQPGENQAPVRPSNVRPSSLLESQEVSDSGHREAIMSESGIFPLGVEGTGSSSSSSSAPPQVIQDSGSRENVGGDQEAPHVKQDAGHVRQDPGSRGNVAADPDEEEQEEEE